MPFATAAGGHHPQYTDTTCNSSRSHCFIAPPALPLLGVQVPRAATIHEYLDWTVTASEAEDPDELVRAEATTSATK